MRRLLRHLGRIIGACLFLTALWVLHRELEGYRYQDIVADLGRIRPALLLLAVGMTVLVYLGSTGYDVLALRYIRHHLAYRKLVLASFIGSAFSHNATIIGGSAARYRIYTSLGVSIGEVTRVVIFCGVMFWLGVFTVGGIVFVLAPRGIPRTFRLSFLPVRLFGLVLLSVVVLYLLVVLVRKTPFHVRGHEFPLPSMGLSLGQIVIASVDRLLATGILYVLLPQGASVTILAFLTAFLVAQAAGSLSYVPGGLGVFETVLVVLLAHFVKTSSLVGALLLYRLLYYLVPLGVAAVLLVLYEYALRRRRHK